NLVLGRYIEAGKYAGSPNDAGATFTSNFQNINIVARELAAWLNDPVVDKSLSVLRVILGFMTSTSATQPFKSAKNSLLLIRFSGSFQARPLGTCQLLVPICICRRIGEVEVPGR